MELSQLLAQTAPLTLQYQGQEAQSQIKTETLTPEYKAQLIALVTNADPEQRKDENAQMVADLVESWDLRLNGEAYPPTYENCLKLSYTMLASFTRQISEFLGEIANPSKRQS